MRPTLIAPAYLLSGLGIAAPLAGAQPSRPPIEITSEPLPLAQGEEGTLAVALVALADIDRLDITVTASKGVALMTPVPDKTLTGLTRGERRDFQIGVRLTSPDFGYVSFAVTVNGPSGPQQRDQALIVGTIPSRPPRVPVGADESLADLTLVKVGGANAVVRFGKKPLVVVTVGDLLGRNKAEVIEIAGALLVIDEAFVGSDGRPNRARVTFKEGDTGGTRVLQRLEEEPPPSTRLTIVDPNPPQVPRKKQ